MPCLLHYDPSMGAWRLPTSWTHNKPQMPILEGTFWQGITKRSHVFDSIREPQPRCGRFQARLLHVLKTFNLTAGVHMNRPREHLESEY